MTYTVIEISYNRAIREFTIHFTASLIPLPRNGLIAIYI